MSGPASDPADLFRRRAWWAPKAGHRAEEYEDAWRVASAPGQLRVAVADGATEAAYAGAWARLLVEAYTDTDAQPAPWPAQVERLCVEWTHARAEQAAQGPWYAEAKAAEGAFSTFLGLTLHAAGWWEAVAAGDSVLFHRSAGGEVLRWPVASPDAFTHRPALVASRPDRPAAPWQRLKGRWEAGDVFALATDALAAWLMSGGADWDAVRRWDEAAFAVAVARARAEGSLHNDDVTLVLLEAGHG